MSTFHIIGLAGFKHSGKDTVAEIISKHCSSLNPYRIGYADALKEEVSQATGCDIEYINANKDNFRLILQGWGTDYRRKLHGDDYWVRKLGNKLLHLNPKHHLVLIPDVRFKNEVDFIKQLNGQVWNVVRFLGTVDRHPSEIELADYKEFDSVIDNTGTLEQLETRVKISLLNHGFSKTLM